MYFLLDVCQNPGILRALYFITLLMDAIFILVPIALIIITIIDFSKAVMSGDAESQSKAAKVIPKRIIYALIIFAVPWIVKVLMNVLDNANIKIGNDYNTCISNAKAGNFDYYDKLLDEEEKTEAEEMAKWREKDKKNNNTTSSTDSGAENSSNEVSISNNGGNSSENTNNTNENTSYGEEYSGTTYNTMATNLMKLVYGEIGKNNGSGKYGPTGYAWCAMFVTWALKNTSNNGVNLFNDIVQKEHKVDNTAGAACTIYSFAHSSNLRFYYSRYYSKKYNKNDGSYVPKAGDVIYFDWKHTWDGSTKSCTSGLWLSHVGIVDYTSNGTVYTVEGNATDKSGNRVVTKKSYSLDSNDIVGYGSWYTVSVDKSNKNNGGGNVDQKK